MLLSRLSTAAIKAAPSLHRGVATLSTNPYIYIHTRSDKTSVLSLLPTSPPKAQLAIGTTTAVPPTPDSLTENASFMKVLHSVLARHATEDPSVQAQAQTFASTAGSSLGSGGVFFSPNRRPDRRRTSTGGGAGGARAQGGMGGAGRGGYIHVSDSRNPPDVGRTAWPEDIFGSLEVDGKGDFVDGHGRYQASGTYRMVTNEGILGLSDYLREKLVERLKELERSD